jgi:drug/metabolite transporter (DMT)-like permease
VNGKHRSRALLALLILSWAISWPVIKVGVADVPPLWYACFRYAIAASCLFAFVAARHELVRPARADWPLVAISGVFQMAAYSALVALALTVLPPGRASVLAFSTPIWVVPLARWWLNERASRAALLGTSLGLLGVLAIASPAVHAENGEQVRAYALLLTAAVCWSVSIVAVRSHRFASTPLSLAPWQMVIAACLLLPLALVVEGAPPSIGPSGVASLAFVGTVATGFAYWAVVDVGRHFRAAVLSMALLAAPTLGILISALTLGESIGASLVAGVLLIATGIRLVTASPRAIRRTGRNRTCE